MSQEIMYRYEDHSGVVSLRKLPVIRRTPRGRWVDYFGMEKFVLDGTLRKFACVDEPTAKASFFARKKKQLAILKAQVTSIESSVKALEEGRLDDYEMADFGFLEFES